VLAATTRPLWRCQSVHQPGAVAPAARACPAPAGAVQSAPASFDRTDWSSRSHRGRPCAPSASLCGGQGSILPPFRRPFAADRVPDLHPDGLLGALTAGRQRADPPAQPAPPHPHPCSAVLAPAAPSGRWATWPIRAARAWWAGRAFEVASTKHKRNSQGASTALLGRLPTPGVPRLRHRPHRARAGRQAAQREQRRRRRRGGVRQGRPSVVHQRGRRPAARGHHRQRGHQRGAAAGRGAPRAAALPARRPGRSAAPRRPAACPSHTTCLPPPCLPPPCSQYEISIPGAEATRFTVASRLAPKAVPAVGAPPRRCAGPPPPAPGTWPSLPAASRRL
jgi:hypothetical protein